MENKVRVIVRTRPFLQDHAANSSCVKIKNKTTLELSTLVSKTESICYKFDACYAMEASQEDIFKEVEGTIGDVLKGINTTIFAYGMTGAGKTHTMQGTQSEPGIIPRVAQLVVDLTSSPPPGTEYEISLSYLEIYNEKVFDLLDPKEDDLNIRQGNHGEIMIPGLCKSKIASFDQFQKTYQLGCKNRTVASTSLNKVSSRSHAILCIYVQTILSDKVFSGKLHLIDLAGSEDNRLTQNRGMRMTESSNINSSLFVLGKVVNALNDGGRIPYRDSKLTRLIQDSLGGQSNAIMIANVAPENHFYSETARTLNFASKSKKIVNKPVVHIEKTAEQQLIDDERKRKLIALKSNKLKKRRNSVDKLRQLKNKSIISDRSSSSSSSSPGLQSSESFYSASNDQITAEVIEQEVKRRLNEEKKALLSPWLKQQQAIENQRDRLEKLEKALLSSPPSSPLSFSDHLHLPSRKRLKIKKNANKAWSSLSSDDDDETDSDYSDANLHNDDDDDNDSDAAYDEHHLESSTKQSMKRKDIVDKENNPHNSNSNKRKKPTSSSSSSQSSKKQVLPLSPSSPPPLPSLPTFSSIPSISSALSPTSKDRAVKELLLKGREEERSNHLSIALSLYSQANSMLNVRNEKLEKKIVALRCKLGVTDHQSSDRSHSADQTDRILEILNKGNIKQLCELHTVGAKRAKLIIQFRTQKPFDSFDDLKRAGFTSKILESFIKFNLVTDQ